MMVLVTGGASSGKSAYAEDIALAFPGPHSYFAAMKPFGAEASRRIERHRALRAGKGFRTVECHEGLVRAVRRALSDGEGAREDELARDDLPSVQPFAPACEPAAGCGAATGTALLECLGNVVANELFSDDGTCASENDALRSVLEGVEALSQAYDHVVIVGNEVGCDGLRYDAGTASYLHVIGAASCALAQRCDVVVECVAAQPMFVKGVLP